MTADRAFVVNPCPWDVVREVATDSTLVAEAKALPESRTRLGRLFSQCLASRLGAGGGLPALLALFALSRFRIASAESMHGGEDTGNFGAPAFASFSAPMNHKLVARERCLRHLQRLARANCVIYRYRLVVDDQDQFARKVAR